MAWKGWPLAWRSTIRQAERSVAVRGRRGEKLTLHSLVLPSVVADAGAAAAGGRWWYLVVRAERGLDRERRYVLHAEAVLPVY